MIQERLESTSLMREVMSGFAERTGLADDSGPPRRYLWTDAFAVCNFLELYRESGEERFLLDALRLVEQVHHVLGRHREDDPREGWISGLNEREGELHPTLGGLRIGKERNERRPGEPLDERQEWDRDGQYFHYLTKWMHALDRVARVTGEACYHRWAMELAKAAHAAFAHVPPGGERKLLYWKMSIDLSRPLVPSMGQHDPLDGLITYQQLQAGIGRFGAIGAGRDLVVEIAEMVEVCEGMCWRTPDPLGIGGLLTDACRLAQLTILDDFSVPDRHELLLERLLDDAVASLENWVHTDPLSLPLSCRLAFRELGLSIGLAAVAKTRDLIACHPGQFPNRRPLETKLANLARCLPWREEIDEFWLRSSSHEYGDWQAHREINSVMLATSLAPDSYLMLENETLPAASPK